MYVNFILNGRGHGDVGEGLNSTAHGPVRFDPGLRRPFIDDDGQRVAVVNTGELTVNKDTNELEPVFKKKRVADLERMGIHSPVFNSTTLRKGDWINIDRVVVRAARQRLKAWADLAAANTVSGINGMGKTTHEYEMMNDPGEAMQDMDGLADGRTDKPLFKLASIPLPITHSDFWYSERQLATSRNSGTPLSMVLPEAAGRRVAELIERQTIGLETGMTFGTETSGYGAHEGTSTIYGYTNFPYRITKTDLTTPTGSNPEAIMQDVLEMRELMYTNGFYGPYMLYTSTGYDIFLDGDYFRTGSTAISRTPRQRILEIPDIQGIRRLDYLTSGYQMIMVQMTSEDAEAIDAMGITTVQWDSQGGLRHNFKVMAIQVPLLKRRFNGTAAIVHATTS